MSSLSKLPLSELAFRSGVEGAAGAVVSIVTESEPEAARVVPAVPVKVGVLSLVMLSVLEEPESLVAFRSGVEGAAGGVVSIVTVPVCWVALLVAASEASIL